MSLALVSRRAAISPAWVKNPLWRTARAVPSLDQPFADTKSLVDAVTGQSLVTFTRASSGTCVGSDGVLQTAAVNEPRFDHNPTTGESLGLLVEEQRTNLLLRSEEFGTTWTSFGNTVSVNTASAPDGLVTADTLLPNSGQSTSGVTQVVPGGLPDSTVYTFSVFIRFAGLTAFNLQFYNKANAFFGSRNLNPQTGQLSGSEFGGTTSVVAYPNGWYRLILANVNSGTGATAPNARIVCSTTGDGISGAYIWGAQLEAGAFPTSYIPTTTAAATRSADVASITGTAFSSWYRQDEGTVFAEGGPASPTLNKTQLLLAINDGSVNNRMYLGKKFDSTTAVEFGVASGGVGQAFILTTPNNVANARLAAGYKVDNFAVASSGGALATDTSGSVLVSSTQLLIGTLDNVSNNIGGTIRRLTFFPQRLPNSTLQAITQ